VNKYVHIGESCEWAELCTIAGPIPVKACGQGLYSNHEDYVHAPIFFFQWLSQKKQNNQPDVLKNGMPTGLNISLFEIEMAAQTKEEKLCCVMCALQLL
jgi:hypothetical protein